MLIRVLGIAVDVNYLTNKKVVLQMEDLIQVFEENENVLRELNSFCELEYGQEALMNNIPVQIAYTNWIHNEEFIVDVYFDIANLMLKKFLIGDDGLFYEEYERYESYEEAIESIKTYDYSSLIVFDAGTDWLIEKLS